MSQADGSIIIDTQLDTQGFEANSAGLGKAIGSLESQISKLGPTFSQAMNGGAGGVQKFKGKADELHGTISKLESELKALGNTRIPTDDYRFIQEQINKTDAELEKLLERQAKMDATGVRHSSSAWRNLQYDIDLAKQKLETYRQDAADLENTGQAYTMGSDTTQYQQMADRLSQAKASLQEMDGAGIRVHSTFSRVVGVLKRGYSVARSIGSAMFRVGRTISGAIHKGASALVSKFKNMKSEVDGTRKKLLKMGIMLLGIRGIATGIRQIVNSALNNNEQLKNQLTALKGVIGTALSPAISFLVGLLSKVVTLADQVYQIFTGTSLIAKYNATQASATADGMANTAKNAKKAKRQLAGFDSLNILSKTDDKSSSSKSNSDSGNTPTPFTASRIKLSKAVSDWFKALKKAFKKGDFKAVGALIADGLNRAMAKIKWGKIRAKAKHIATKIADLINGFTKKFKWGLLGKTIGNGIMTAVDFTYRLLNRINFKRIGKGIARTLNGVLKTTDFKQVGKTLGSVIQSAINIAFGFVTTFNWTNAGKSVSDTINNFFRKINWSQLGQTFSKGITGVFSFIYTALQNIDFKKIGRDLAFFIKNIDWKKIVTSLVNIIGAVIQGVLGLVFGFAETFFAENDPFASFSEKEYDIISATDEMTRSFKENKKARDSLVKEKESEFSYYKDLWKELQSIVDENGKVKKGYVDRARFIANTLSEKLGLEIKLTGNQIKGYQNLRKEIAKTIELKRAEAMLQANEESYNEAVKNRQEAEKNYAYWQATLSKTASGYKKKVRELNKQIKEAQDKLNKEMQKGSYNTNRSALTDAAKRVEKLKNQLNSYKKHRKDMHKELNKSQKTYLGYLNTITNYENASAAIMSGNPKKIKIAIEKMNKDFVTAKNGTEKTLKAQVKAFKKAYKDMKTAQKSRAAGITKDMVKNAKKMADLAEKEYAKVSKKADKGLKSTDYKKTGKFVMKHYESGISSQRKSVLDEAKTVSKYTNNGLKSQDFKKTGKKTGSDYKAGVSSTKNANKTVATSLSALVNKAFGSSPFKITGTTAGTKFKSGVSSTKNANKTTAQSISNTTNKGLASANFKGAGTSAGNKFKSGVSSTNTASKLAATGISAAVNRAFGSKDFKGTGESATTKFSKGVGSKNVKDSAKTSGSGVGGNVIAGLIKGIKDAWDGFVKFWKEKIGGVINIAKTILGIHSPSTVFKAVGGFLMTGLKNGIVGNTKAVLNSMSGVAQAVTAEIQKGDYSITPEVNKVSDVQLQIDRFTDVIGNGVDALMSKLNYIAQHVTFRVPNIALGTVLPYSVKATQKGTGKGSYTYGSFWDDPRFEELLSVIIQSVRNQSTFLGNKIDEHKRVPVYIDPKQMTNAVTTEINRRTRVTGKSPLLI